MIISIMHIFIQIIDNLFTLYMILLFVRIIGSWLPEFSHTRFMQFVAFLADPYLNIFRKIIPPLGMIDFSPIVAFFALQILHGLVKQVIFAVA